MRQCCGARLLQHDRLVLLHKAVALVERETGRSRVEQEGGTLATVRPVEAAFKQGGADAAFLHVGAHRHETHVGKTSILHHRPTSDDRLVKECHKTAIWLQVQVAAQTLFPAISDAGPTL